MPRKPLPIKRNIEFGQEMNSLFDVYADGTKIRNGHNMIKGHVALHLAPDSEIEISFEPHDPRIPQEGILTADGLEPYVDEAAIARQIEEEQRRETEKAKTAAAEKVRAEIKKRQAVRFEKSKETQKMQSGGVIPKPVAPK